MQFSLDLLLRYLSQVKWFFFQLKLRDSLQPRVFYCQVLAIAHHEYIYIHHSHVYGGCEIERKRELMGVGGECVLKIKFGDIILLAE